MAAAGVAAVAPAEVILGGEDQVGAFHVGVAGAEVVGVDGGPGGVLPGCIAGGELGRGLVLVGPGRSPG